jgi:hypothetical protein
LAAAAASNGDEDGKHHFDTPAGISQRRPRTWYALDSQQLVSSRDVGDGCHFEVEDSVRRDPSYDLYRVDRLRVSQLKSTFAVLFEPMT